MKHRRSNGELRANARNAVKLWHLDRVENGRNRFRAVNGKPVLIERAVTQVAESSRPFLTKTSKPITANGREKRAPRQGGGVPFGAASGYVGEQQRFIYERRLAYIEKTMLHLRECCTEAYEALEMSASGYSIESVAEEIGCGRDLAREYLEIGLAIVISVLKLRPWTLDNGEN